MKKQKKEQILIPEGCFEGYCGGCFYAKKTFVDARTGETLHAREGEIFCKKQGDVYPESDHDYDCYEGKIVNWIKIILGIYFTVLAISLVFSLIF
ncbi:MAG: hypothetical protein J6K04_13095 [Lachnospiraceae bacterium]|nr:hypothetical protein [Lachnospiraceae bacterium]